jgi:hypothetical protein
MKILRMAFLLFGSRVAETAKTGAFFLAPFSKFFNCVRIRFGDGTNFCDPNWPFD